MQSSLRAELVQIGVKRQDCYCRDRHDRIVTSWQNSVGQYVGRALECVCLFVIVCLYLSACICMFVFVFVPLPLHWSKDQLATYGTVVTLQVRRSAMWSHLLFRDKP